MIINWPYYDYWNKGMFIIKLSWDRQWIVVCDIRDAWQKTIPFPIMEQVLW